MKKLKLWLELHQDDLKGMIKILIIIFLIYSIRSIPQFIRDSTLSRFDNETVGIIVSIKLIKGIDETQVGGILKTKIYEVEYYFRVKGHILYGKEKISRKTISLEQRIKIEKLTQSDSIIVKYNSKQPKKSMIIIKK